MPKPLAGRPLRTGRQLRGLVRVAQQALQVPTSRSGSVST
jgi:hypothetical protein